MVLHRGSTAGAPAETLPAAPRWATTSVLIAYLILGGLLPLVIIADTTAPSASSAWWLALLIITWSSLRLAIIIGRGRPRLFNFVFWLYVYLFLGLAPLAQIRSGRFPPSTPDVDDTRLVPTFILIILGLLSFEAGAMAQRAARNGRQASRNRLERHDISRPRAIALCVLGLAGAVYYARNVGLVALFGSRESANLARQIRWSDSAVQSLATGIGFVPLLVGVHALISLRHSRRKGIFDTTLLLVSIAVLAVTVNPVSSTRAVFGTVAFSLFVAVRMFSTVRRTRAAFLVIILLMVVAFPIADVFRRTQADIKVTHLTDSLTNWDQDSFVQISNTLIYVDDHGLTNGRQLLGTAAFWVPRTAWADKPQPTAAVVADNRGYPGLNLAMPLWGEIYIDFGWTGVVLGFSLLGWLLADLDRRLAGSLRIGGVAAIAGGILAFYQLILIRGPLLPSMGYLVLITASLLVIYSPRSGSALADRPTPLAQE